MAGIDALSGRRGAIVDAVIVLAGEWEKQCPKVARLLRDDFESCLTACDLPSAHRRRLNSTNMLERVMRELKRRTRVISIFPNRASCQRLIGARLAELLEQWETEECRYIAMDALDETQQIKQLSA